MSNNSTSLVTQLWLFVVTDHYSGDSALSSWVSGAHGLDILDFPQGPKRTGRALVSISEELTPPVGSQRPIEQSPRRMHYPTASLPLSQSKVCSFLTPSPCTADFPPLTTLLNSHKPASSFRPRAEWGDLMCRLQESHSATVAVMSFLLQRAGWQGRLCLFLPGYPHSPAPRHTRAQVH